jgi:chemotaxis protein CheY-P-specific phosphatase CheC
MSSTTLPDLIGPETADAILAALRTVAERSFFAEVEPCDDRTFGRLTSGVSSWLVATVRFEEGTAIGAMSCTLPEELATALADAFTGRDPSAAEPARAHVLDLIGEFANMVCGAWLSHSAAAWTFRLSPPTVEAALEPAPADLLQLIFVTVNDRPLAITVRLLQPGSRDAAFAAGS